MKALMILLSVFFVLSVIPVSAQDTTSGTKKEARKSRYQKLSQPGEAHKLLATLEGNWNQEIKVYPSPGSEPINLTGTSTNAMILGGRFLKMEGKGGEGELYMESLTIMGYDNRFGQYTTVGFDTWGTYYVTAAGKIKQDGKTIVMSGTDTDPIMGVNQEYNIIITIDNPDRYTSEVVFTNKEMTGGEEEFKVVEVAYTRVK